jgi:hypothetical protein
MKRSLGIAVGIALVLVVLFYGSSYLTGTKASLVPGQAPPVLNADPGTPTGTTGGDPMVADPGTTVDGNLKCSCECVIPADATNPRGSLLCFAHGPRPGDGEDACTDQRIVTPVASKNVCDSLNTLACPPAGVPYYEHVPCNSGPGNVCWVPSTRLGGKLGDCRLVVTQ